LNPILDINLNVDCNEQAFLSVILIFIPNLFTCLSLSIRSHDFY